MNLTPLLFLVAATGAPLPNAPVSELDLDRYSGRVVSFLAAATATWILNRSFTFRRDSASETHPAGEWLAYLGLMVIGGLVNYGTYAAAVALLEPVHRHPVIGVAMGSIAGMAINFWTSKTLVFERKPLP